jgi:formiminotetrahydrofolate cyclodeaminase
MEAAVKAARSLAERVAEELDIPVYLYGEAALRRERTALPQVRRFDLEVLRRAIAEDPDRAPDHGPRALHPRFGAVAIGARRALVAYNVDLHAADPAVAHAIASAIRERGGGLPRVRALGMRLPSRNQVQVSCNLLDAETTSPRTVFEAIKEEAAQRQAIVDRSELVGLIPRAAVYRSASEAMALSPLGPAQILEDRLADSLPLLAYLESVADPRGGPGGAAVAADVGAMAASLGAFVEGVTRKGRTRTPSVFEDLSLRFQRLSRRDQEAYQSLLAARKRSPGSERAEAVEAALREACEAPILILETALAALQHLAELPPAGTIYVDVRVAATLLRAVAESARATLEVNLRAKAAKAFAPALETRARELVQSIEQAAETVSARVTR